MLKENNINDDLELENFDDHWLSENLNQLMMNPSGSFTDDVMAKLDIKPKQSVDTPIFWILIIIPAIIIISGLLFSIKPIMEFYDFNNALTRLNYPLLVIGKYLFFLLITGLLLVGLDYFISKNLAQKKSLISPIVF